MISFENSAFVCLVAINLIGFISCFVIMLKSALKKNFLKMPKSFQKVYVLVIFAAPMFGSPLVPQPRFEPSYVIFIIGTILALLSVLIWIQAFKQIGIIPGIRQKSKVITSGIYGIVRHPLYLGSILMLLGLALAFRAVYALLYAPVIIILFTVTIFIEEKSLTEEYREEYLAYKRKVKWRLIPWVI
ncbi:MAG: isoprenylcysteine carboxylmethyltransferase family protein [Sedimentisphaerales bacterium]|nr:isoprenylcysteine carboxylmethyltransferase family protein [Sedimentisphaerales bacterium]